MDSVIELLVCSVSDARIEELGGQKDGEAKIRSDLNQAEKVCICLQAVSQTFWFTPLEPRFTPTNCHPFCIFSS